VPLDQILALRAGGIKINLEKSRGSAFSPKKANLKPRLPTSIQELKRRISMSDTPTAGSPQGQSPVAKEEIERERKDNLRFSQVEVKLDGGVRILPLPE
jgi:hypothetical protein